MISDDTDQEFENKPSGNFRDIPGWGVDINPKNDPTYPMKIRTDEEIRGYTWKRPVQQISAGVEVLKSVERPNISAVFGTSVPPSGLSGVIRRLAFKKSESTLARWAPLLLADRINVVEGFIGDIFTGHIPNIYTERGWRAEMKYNRKKFLLKSLLFLVILTLLIIWILD